MDIDLPANLIEDIPPPEHAAIIQSGRLIHCRSGQTLFCEGEPADHCYLMVRGRMKLVKIHEDGQEAVIRYLGPGDFMAAVSVFKGRRYPVTARAIGDADVMAWDRSALDRLLVDHPALTRNLLRMALDRLEEIQSRFMELRNEKVEQRLARALLRIMTHAGKKTPAGILIDLPLSRQELADYIGTTLYTVSRTLSNWDKKGWINSGRERVVILDPHALATYAETA